jgi:hypothetical protein
MGTQRGQVPNLGLSRVIFSPGPLRTADYNDVREGIKFENQNSIPYCPAPPTPSALHISVYDFPTS